MKNIAMRIAKITRKTKETDITATINIDGIGEYNISTGVGFLDHMLEQLSRHGLIDINLQAKGDTHIDFHHITEDVGITLGKAIRKALGDRKGITRYGHSYAPMDETLSRTALDISGRSYLVWNVKFSRDKIGDFDTELFKEFFEAIAGAAGITLHIENLYGENSHHIAESIFKSFARALRMACTIDVRAEDSIPSTKGSL